jgi:hypothetical protein
MSTGTIDYGTPHLSTRLGSAVSIEDSTTIPNPKQRRTLELLNAIHL